MSNSTVSNKKGGKSLAKKQGGAPEGSRRDRYQGPSAQSAARQEILPAFPPPLFVSSFLSHVVSYDVWLPRCDNMS